MLVRSASGTRIIGPTPAMLTIGCVKVELARVGDDHRALGADHLGRQGTGKWHLDVEQIVRAGAVGDDDAQPLAIRNADGGHVGVAELTGVLRHNCSAVRAVSPESSVVATSRTESNQRSRCCSSAYSCALAIATPACVASTRTAASSSSVNSGAALLVGEVDVAEDAAVGTDRCAEKRAHRRMVRRKARWNADPRRCPGCAAPPVHE